MTNIPDTEGSALPNPGAVQTSDRLVAIRPVQGNSTFTTVTVQAGTAAAKTATDNSKPNVASVGTGSITAGHMAVFADTSGTIIDGGTPGGATGTAAAKAASDNTKGVLASVAGSTVVGHVATFADTAGSVQDGGTLAAVAISGAYNDLSGKPTLGSAAALAAGSASGVATLDGTGKVPTSQLPSSIVNGLEFAGLWNASTNTPTLVSGTGTQGTMQGRRTMNC